MNTNLLIAAMGVFSLSLAMYMFRRRIRLNNEISDPETAEARKLWEDTHTFSDWAVAHIRNKKVRLIPLKR